MDNITFVGLMGGIILVLGAAREEKKHIHPRKSAKERLFAIGGVIMLIYAIWGYFTGGNVLYILLELFICIASRLKMMKEQGKYDMWLLAFLGVSLIVISYLIDKSPKTLRFIAGFITVALGYIIRAKSIERNAALTIGGILIAIFSYFESSRVFFGVNIFFAFFSAYYRMKYSIEQKDG